MYMKNSEINLKNGDTIKILLHQVTMSGVFRFEIEPEGDCNDCDGEGIDSNNEECKTCEGMGGDYQTDIGVYGDLHALIEKDMYYKDG